MHGENMVEVSAKDYERVLELVDNEIMSYPDNYVIVGEPRNRATALAKEMLGDLDLNQRLNLLSLLEQIVLNRGL